MSDHSEVSLPPGLEAVRVLTAEASHRRFARWLMIVLAAAIGALFLPWQQNVQANGTVTALRPSDRPQTIPAVIGGRIVSWEVAEGDVVKAGDPILRLAEAKDQYLDPRTLERQRTSLRAKELSLEAKRAKAEALTRQLTALREGVSASLDKTRNKVTLYDAALRAAELDSAIAAAQLTRQEALFRDGLKSLTDLEGARTKAQKATATLIEKRAETENARLELRSVSAEYGDKIAKAEGERASTVADAEESAAEIAKMRSTLSSFEARTGYFVVRAPQAGTVVKALRAGVGDVVKDGEAIATIQPASPQLAVALDVKAMDVPLLRAGRQVRLQFDGWPALQFSGWPSASVGTFGGVIRVVDLVDSKPGTYRVLVVPDSADTPWPAQLRVGSGVYGWAMLDRVRVWFELWRKFNGFPPTVQPPPPGADAGAKK